MIIILSTPFTLISKLTIAGWTWIQSAIISANNFFSVNTAPTTPGSL
jgi:hypothetical protein